jgi:hypothetical protein
LGSSSMFAPTQSGYVAFSAACYGFKAVGKWQGNAPEREGIPGLIAFDRFAGVGVWLAKGFAP